MCRQFVLSQEPCFQTRCLCHKLPQISRPIGTNSILTALALACSNPPHRKEANMIRALLSRETTKKRLRPSADEGNDEPNSQNDDKTKKKRLGMIGEGTTAPVSSEGRWATATETTTTTTTTTTMETAAPRAGASLGLSAENDSVYPHMQEQKKAQSALKGKKRFVPGVEISAT